MRATCAIAAMSIMASVLMVTASARNIRDHRNPSRAGSAYDMGGPPLLEVPLTFGPFKMLQCETRNATAGADPVLHLLRGADPDGAVTQVAMDDDSAGNLNARLRYRVLFSRRYLLVLRAAHSSATGKADLWCDGVKLRSQAPVGGSFKRLEQLRAGERLQTVTLPRGPQGHRLYLLDDEGNLLYRQTSGAADSATIDAPSQSMLNAMVGAADSEATGLIRLVRNDAPLSGHDSDGDGLGDELEQFIGTCSKRQQVLGNWECSRSTDMRDTDGDGLSDKVEFLGDVAAAPYQHLPRWGANPLHKDLFLEVDYGKRNPGDSTVTLSPGKARIMAAIYGDTETSPLLRLRNAQSLNNPDGQSGIALHFDSGVTPAADAPATDFVLYGDWGGHNDVAAVRNGTGWKRADPDAARQSMMASRRQPYFHYALGDPTSGGQAPNLVPFLNLPLFSGLTAAHELGHTLGLEHYGPHGVEVEIGDKKIEANCKPNYPSVMSYAFLGQSGISFSGGFGRSVINNVNLKEWHAVSSPAGVPGRRYLEQLRDVFGFGVDIQEGSIDWNRDGVISQTPVRAYANDNGSGCEFTRFNKIIAPGLADGAVSLARLGSRTFLAYIDERDRRLHISHSDDPMHCLEINSSCGSFTDSVPSGPWWVRLNRNANMRSVDMAVINTSVGRRILLVLRSTLGLFEARMGLNGKPDNFRMIEGPPVPDTELSLASDGQTSWLATRETDGLAAVRTRDRAGNWSAPQTMLDASDGKPFTLPFLSSPGLYWSTLEGGRLYAALPVAPEGKIVLRYLRPDGRWSRPGWNSDAFGTRSTGRPAIAMQPAASGATIPGRMWIAYLDKRDADQNSGIRILTLAARSLQKSDGVQFRNGWFDNSWFYGNGVDLLFEPGKDDQLRLAAATAIVKDGVRQPHVIEMRPLAGGIVNFIQRNWDDWEALGIGLCQVRDLGGGDMHCPPWPFKAPAVFTGTPAPLPGPTPPDTHPSGMQCIIACTREMQQCIREHEATPGTCRAIARQCRRQC